ncbi:jg11189 [Pararge aegeria aegeria]|uniref:Jg11189 protein n=1 Tax=Pararge aegeria aegeria TaxID=348720 RepID=A0A8S4RK42_9NEOP|nr:jg11189 [Pararge aegeria aegeria]
MAQNALKYWKKDKVDLSSYQSQDNRVTKAGERLLILLGNGDREGCPSEPSPVKELSTVGTVYPKLMVRLMASGKHAYKPSLPSQGIQATSACNYTGNDALLT